MESHSPATPFGRRPITLGQIATRMKLRQALEAAARPGANVPAAVNKWQLFRTLTEIRDQIGVSDRALSVLNALLSFQPETALSLPKPDLASAQDRVPSETDEPAHGGSCELVVFPSNRALSLRAHGMAPATLRRHLAALVEAGLIIRRDSPNGKRYAHKAGQGDDRFVEAFGFDLTPLVTRAPEFEAVAEEVRRLARARALVRERISLCRRDISKLIACGVDESLPGDWASLGARFMALSAPLRRIRDDREIDALADALASLRSDALKLLESRFDSTIQSGNADHHERHHSNSNTDHIRKFEPASEEEGTKVGADGSGAPPASTAPEPERAPEVKADASKALPLGMVLEACPDVIAYAPAGEVRGWAGFCQAVALIRPMLGISPDAWQLAREALGEIEAHVLVASILQRSEHSSEAKTHQRGTGGPPLIEVNGSPAIRSPGGYLRTLTEQARAGEFSLGPVLMALIGQRLKRRRETAAP